MTHSYLPLYPREK